MRHLDDIRNILCEVLGLDASRHRLTSESRLLGGIPEFDSMAVISLISVLEDRFGIAVADDEINARTFDTVGTLATFVEQKLPA